MAGSSKFFNGAYNGRRVLVTGHTGFKGAWLCEWLLSLGADVAGFSLGTVSTPSLFEVNGLAKRMRHFEGDVRELGALQKVFKEFRPEVVFHLAAQSLVRASYDDPKTSFDTNVGGTVNCLEAIRLAETVKAAVIVTTDKCYENVGWVHGYRENDRLGGKDPYSASKAAAEIVSSAYIRSFFSQGPSVATVRAGNVIGGGDWAVDRIVPDCIRAWESEGAVTLRNPDHVRPWQHVLEPLAGYLHLGSRLLENDPQAAGEAFNFGPDDRQCQTVKLLVQELVKNWKKPAEIRLEKQETGKAEAAFLRLNCDKAMHQLKWYPVLSFLQTAKLTAEWYEAYLTEKTTALAVTRNQIEQYQAWASEAAAVWAVFAR